MNRCKGTSESWEANPASAYVHFDPVPSFSLPPARPVPDYHKEYVRLLKDNKPIYTEPDPCKPVFGSQWSQVREITGQFGQPVPFVDGSIANTLHLCKELPCLHTRGESRRHIPLYSPLDTKTVYDYIAQLRHTAACAKRPQPTTEFKKYPYVGTRANPSAERAHFPYGCNEAPPWLGYQKTEDYWKGFFANKTTPAWTAPLPPIKHVPDSYYDDDALGCFEGRHTNLKPPKPVHDFN